MELGELGKGIEVSNNILREESYIRQNDFVDETEKSNKEDKQITEDIANRIVDSANKYFLVKVLSPEITKNEEKKREHKDKLISIIKYFLLFQFLIISLLLIGIVTMIFVFHGLGNDLEISYIDIIIKFVSVYITSVVAELIAMLHYIVSKVFDTSITGLVEIYKDATNTKNDRLKVQEN